MQDNIQLDKIVQEWDACIISLAKNDLVWTSSVPHSCVQMTFSKILYRIIWSHIECFALNRNSSKVYMSLFHYNEMLGICLVNWRLSRINGQVQTLKINSFLCPLSCRWGLCAAYWGVLQPERSVVWPQATILVLSAHISQATPSDVSDRRESLSS